MKRFSNPYATLGPSTRATCTVAAVSCATIVNVGLLVLFDQASSERWLSPTPSVLQAQAQCDALPARQARSSCTQTLVARTLALGVRTAQVSAP